MKDTIAIINPEGNARAWADTIKKLDENINVEAWPDISNRDCVTTAICWKQPYGVLSEFKNLKLAASLAAGADHILNDETINKEVFITRVIDPSMAYNMSRYILSMILLWERDLFKHIRHQDACVWEDETTARDVKVLIIGNGNIGSYLCENLKNLSYNVITWSLSLSDTLRERNPDSDHIKEALHASTVVVGILPLTQSTKNIYNKEFFSKFSKGSLFIQVGRGAQLVEEDLLWAINEGFVGHAVLDVFPIEPLEKNHAFWNHEQITVTPHVAGINDRDFACRQIIENHKKVCEGKTPDFLVSRDKEY